MKRKLVLIFMTCAAGASSAAFAQGSAPNCVVSNYDRTRDLFTIVAATPEQMNQQCFLTVHAAGEASAPGQFVEGKYEVLLSGGGGGGGGGTAAEGGGGGGAGALPDRTVRDLRAGVYRLTIGRGGEGGAACLTQFNGGRGGDGYPTSVANAHTGQTIAGFPRAEYWAGRPAQSFQVASSGSIPAIKMPENDGSGGRGFGGQSNGGDGGQTERGNEKKATDGTPLAGGSWGGQPGKGGHNFYSSSLSDFAGGGGGGAGFGNGGDGHSMGSVMTAAKPGDLGGGGGGGGGGEGTCAEGAPGGDGFIKLSLLAQATRSDAPAAVAPAAPAVREVAPAPVPAEPRPIRRDRN